MPELPEVETMRRGILGIDFALRHVVVQPVQLFPHLGADLLADLRRVLTRPRDTGDDRRPNLAVCCKAALLSSVVLKSA